MTERESLEQELEQRTCPEGIDVGMITASTLVGDPGRFLGLLLKRGRPYHEIADLVTLAARLLVETGYSEEATLLERSLEASLSSSSARLNRPDQPYNDPSA